MANTNANGRVVAPAVLQAQLSTDVVGFNLENNQASALGQQYITFQETFLPGEVTTSTHLVAIVGGQKIPVQMDVKTTNADGSVRSALLTFEQPSISANSSLSFMLSTTGTAFATGPLSLAGLNDSNYNLKVTIALQGGSTVVLDAATLLEQALNAGTVSYWQTGPLATQGRIDVPIAGSLHVTLDITRYADGSTSTDVQFNNDYAMQAVGGTAVYNVTIQQNGSTVLQQSNITEYQYQTWHTVVSTTGPSHANVVQDINYLELTGAVPNLDLAAGVDPAALAAERITGNQILGPGSVTKYMPTAGGRSDIGQMPGWNAIWLMTQDEQAAKYALVQADAAGSVPWHYFDPKTGTYLSVTDYPTLWSDPRGTPTLTQQPSSSSGWTPEAAHQPDLSYVAYLLTGDRYYLDQLNAQATFSVFSDWPVYRENGLGLVANGSDEVRAQAWSLRVIDEAAWANPTGSVEQQAFAQLADNNWSWLVSQIPAWTQRQGEAYGYVPGTYGDGSGSTMAPWQQDYFASTAIQAAQMGNADALTFLNWQANFLVGRFLNGANGFNPHDGANYNLIVGNGSGTTYKTWAQIGQATVAAGISWGNGWGDGDYAELAAQTLAGIITLTGSAAATQAYNWLMSSGAPQIKPYFVDPQFDVVPRQTVNTGSATLSIVAVNATQSEGATGTTPFTFTVTRGGNTSIATSASWAAAGSGANPAAGSDFVDGVMPSGTVSFAAGETSKTITVNVAGDTVVEPNEGFTVTLSNPATSTTIGTATANGTIRNDDTSPASLSIAALSADKVEGSSGSTAFTFTVTRGDNTSIATSASWAAAGSGANPAAGSDFVGGVMPSGTVSFAAGETSKTITVNVAGDTVGEPDEGFTVTLSNPATSTTIGTATASGTIRNDDTSQASLSIAALSADKVEGQSESTAFTFTVTRGGNTSIATSASWAAAGSGANPAAGSDFVDGVMPSGTVSFAAGETSKTITVNVAGDTVGEPDEGFTVTLSNPATSTTIGTATANGTIRDDDVASLSIAALSADKVEGQSESTAFTFTVTRGGNTSITTSAGWVAAGSGANPAAGSDFVDGVMPSGTVSFAAGETSKTITVNVAGDTVGEPDEGFTVTLSNPATSTTIGTATANGMIRDDDVASLSIAALSADKVEGQSGSTAFTFTVTRGGNTSIATSASWVAAGSGANPAAGSDFVDGVMPSGTVSFAAGETSKTITVNVAGDTVGEPDEGFTVTLSNPATSTTIGTATANGMIRDDDVASLSIAALSADKVEGQSGSTAFTFTVTRGGNTSIATSASWVAAGSGANPAAGSDFVDGVLPSGTVSFAAGETSKTITVNVAGNTVVEPNEGFAITLSNPATNTTIGTATASGTIRNDDTSPASLSIAALSADKVEGSSGSTAFTFTVTRGGNTSIATSASWAAAGSGANPAAGSDFVGAVLPSGTVSFAAGETSKTITVNVAGDTVVEPDEGFAVTLSNPAANTTTGTATANGTIRDDDSASGPLITAIETSGQTRLYDVGDAYFMYPASGAPVALKVGGAMLAEGQLGAWQPIGAEQVGGGYQVAWKLADNIWIWNVDSGGNYVSNIAYGNGSQWALQSAETTFRQDLNGDHAVGPLITAIETSGQTRLYDMADAYFMYPASGAPVALKVGGAMLAEGQLGAWQPIGAEQVGGGYQVAWKLADNIWIWNVDSGGNYVSNIAYGNGSQWALQSAETTFRQDLNGDHAVGPLTTAIEGAGQTRLYDVADAYFLYPSSGASVALKVGGAMLAEGQLGAWQPIGAEQVGGGYQVAWKLADNIWIWNVDSGGNYVSNIAYGNGSQWALQSAETTFRQDLNGDHAVGPLITAIEGSGQTRLYDMADAYFMYPASGAPVALKVGGAMLAEGQFGAWQPKGAERVGDGYEVVWQNGTANQYMIWDVDSNGNERSSTAVISGDNPTLEALEGIFRQDLNHDSIIG